MYLPTDCSKYSFRVETKRKANIRTMGLSDKAKLMHVDVATNIASGIYLQRMYSYHWYKLVPVLATSLRDRMFLREDLTG